MSAYILTALLAAHSAYAYVSRPDLSPPVSWNISVLNSSTELSQGYTFMTAASPAIYDNSGEPIWIAENFTSTNKTVANGTTCLGPQSFNGEDHLVYYFASGDAFSPGGEIRVLNHAYEIVETIVDQTNLTNGHEANFLSNGNVPVVTSGNIVDGVDTIGLPNGTADTTVEDGCFQELTLAGKPVFSFCALSGGISPYASFATVGPSSSSLSLPMASVSSENSDPWDYIHVNSVDKDALGNYLLSGRHTCAVYYISGSTGKILWTLGGKNSSFTGSGTEFFFQHDPRFVGEVGMSAETVQAQRRRRITLFDNENGITIEPVHNVTVSRGLMIELDLDAKTAAVVQKFTAPEGLTSFAMGDVQLLSQISSLGSSNVVLGFGMGIDLSFTSPTTVRFDGFKSAFAEYAADGAPLRFVQYVGSGAGDVSYRVFKADWVGEPNTDPDVAVQDGTLYVSWNGATEVASWQIEQGTNSNFSSTTTVGKAGFETAVQIAEGLEVRVAALSANGTVLGLSREVST